MLRLNEIELFERTENSIWTDPYIAGNLLKAHLDDTGDGASRNRIVRNKTVEWIDEQLNASSRILDLGCGPGLYDIGLAGRGHTVCGIDLNGASIRYAEKNNQYEEKIRYRLGNYLQDDIGSGFSAAIMIYCDFGALIPQEQHILLRKVWDALTDNGLFIFDVFGSALPQEKPEKRDWTVSAGNDFWSEEPYFLLEEVRHFPEAGAIGSRHIVIGRKKREIKEYIMWDQYYDGKKISRLLEENGFSVMGVHSGLIDHDSFTSKDVMFITAKKSANGYVARQL